MRMMRSAGMSLAGLALLVVASGPAAADPKRGEDRGRRHEHRDKDDGVGGFVLGALLAGGLVAALSAKKKPEPLPQDVAFVPVAASALPSQADEEAAVAACAASVESEGRRTFPIAQVGRVAAVEPAGPGFVIRGELLTRGSWRDAGEPRTFRCSVDGDAIDSVAIDGLSMPAPAS